MVAAKGNVSSFFLPAAMHRTPLQTLLAERLQSAKGLGWDMDAPKKSASEKSSGIWAGFALPGLLRWFRVALK